MYRKSWSQYRHGKYRDKKVEKLIKEMVIVVFKKYHKLRYHDNVRYVTTDDGFIEIKKYAEDLFAIVDFVTYMSADGNLVKSLAYIHSFTDFELSDRHPVSRAKKISYCKEMSIEPAGVYCVDVSCDIDPCNRDCKASFEITRSYRGALEKVKLSFSARTAFHE